MRVRVPLSADRPRSDNHDHCAVVGHDRPPRNDDFPGLDLGSQLARRQPRARPVYIKSNPELLYESAKTTG